MCLRGTRRLHDVTREGMCFRAHGPAHQLDGSQPRRWVRRTSQSGKSNDRRECAPTPAQPTCYTCAHISARAAIGYTQVLTCLFALVRRRHARGIAVASSLPSPPPLPPPS